MASLSLIIDGRPAKVGAREFKQAVDSIKREGREATKSTDKVERGFKKVQDRSAGLKRAVAGVFAGLSAALVARQITQVVSGYELVLATVKGVTGATDEQFARLQATARELGATTRFSAKEAGEGLLFLARAGFTTEQALAAVPATLNLAAAGAVELGEAADWASNILSQFGLAAEETERVTDTLIKTANSSNTDVRQLAEAMKFAGPVAGALGISVERTAASLGVLGDSGIQASLAGTNLRGILAGLLGPTTAAEKAVLRLGLTMKQVDPATVDLVDIFRRFREAGLTAADAVDIFGRRNAAAAIILANGVDKVESLTEANVAARGEAERIARVMSDTLAGSFKNLRSAIEEAFLQIGDNGFTGGLRGIVDVATEAIRILLGLGDAAKVSSDAAFRLAASIRAAGYAFATYFGARAAIAVATNPVLLLVASLSAAVGTLAYAWADAAGEAEKHAIKVLGLEDSYRGLSTTLDRLAAAEDAHTNALRRKSDFLRQQANERRLEALAGQLAEFERLAQERGRDALSPVRAADFQQLVPDFYRDNANRTGPFTFFQNLGPGAQGQNIGTFPPDGSGIALGDAFERLIASGGGERLVKLGFVIDALKKEIAAAEEVADRGAKALEGRARVTDEQRAAILAERDAVEEANEVAEERNSILSRFIDISVQAAQLVHAEELRKKEVAEFIDQLRTQLAIEQEIGLEREVLTALTQVGVSVTEQEAAAIRDLVERLRELRNTREDEAKYRAQQVSDQQELNRKYQEEQRRRKAAIDDTLRQIEAFSDQLGQGFADAFNRAILEGQGFKAAFRGLLKDLQSIIVQELTRSLIARPLANAFQEALGSVLGGGATGSTRGGGGGLFGIFSQAFGGPGGRSALGNAFLGGNVIPFARGGILDSPIVFGLSGGRAGIAGEAGPEAVLPLRRGRNGKLGVETSGGGASTPVVHMTVVTQDAASFQRSGRQITNQLRRALNRRPA